MVNFISKNTYILYLRHIIQCAYLMLFSKIGYLFISFRCEDQSHKLN